MARTTLVKTVAKGNSPSLPLGAGSVTATFAAADVGNMNQFLPGGEDLLIAYNSGASPYTVTITSAPDQMNRTGDITTYSLAAGDIAVFGPFKLMGWVQADGYVYLQASNASVKLAVIAMQ